MQPEWYFTHVLNVAHEHRLFMESIIQKLLASSEYKLINAWVSIFIASLTSELKAIISASSHSNYSPYFLES